MNVPTLPTRQEEFRRVFTPIDGEEMQAAILAHVKDVMARDGRFGRGLAFPLFAFRVRVELVAQPSRDGKKIVSEMSGGAMVVDPETNEICYDTLWPHALALVGVADSGVITSPDELRAAVGLELPHVRKSDRGHTYQRTFEPIRRNENMANLQDIYKGLDPRTAAELKRAHSQVPHREADGSYDGQFHTDQETRRSDPKIQAVGAISIDEYQRSQSAMAETVAGLEAKLAEQSEKVDQLLAALAAKAQHDTEKKEKEDVTGTGPAVAGSAGSEERPAAAGKSGALAAAAGKK